MISLHVSTPPRAVVWAVALGGVIALFVTLWSGLASWRLVSGGARATGTVIQLAKGEATGPAESAAPVFRFHDAAGREHTVASSFYRSPPAHRVGETVPVVYPPAEPSAARIATFAYLWLLPAVAGGFAVFCLALLALVVWRGARAGRREAGGGGRQFAGLLRGGQRLWCAPLF